jgi:bacterioferritin-associated ferredoxin
VYVCHCRAVNDRAIAAAVDRGARCVEDVERMCGAGTQCGSCHPEIERLLSERAARLSQAPAWRERAAV